MMDNESEQILPVDFAEYDRSITQQSRMKTYKELSPYREGIPVTRGFKSTNNTNVLSPLDNPLINNYDKSPEPMPDVLWVNYLGDPGRKTNYIERPIKTATHTIYEPLIAIRKVKKNK
jgi:hypothetical protein